jgi:ATP-dependent RNA helicase SUPV3L1/SUV3
MTACTKSPDTQALDALTGGAFSAPTSGERAARCANGCHGPGTEQMQEVFRELSARDKGAARALRERSTRSSARKGQEAIAAEWADKAQALLAQPRMNIADAMAWQRDAAKAGAPLSREPLAGLKAQPGRAREACIEDLQTPGAGAARGGRAAGPAHRGPVHQALARRPGRLGRPAHRRRPTLAGPRPHALLDDAGWPSVDPKFPPLLDASRAQLLVVWEAFQSRAGAGRGRRTDAAAPLPPVPVWADELRVARGRRRPEEAGPRRPGPRWTPKCAPQANRAVTEVLDRWNRKWPKGHGKASAGCGHCAAQCAQGARQAGRGPTSLENQAHAALAAAGELEGWQRWRADQLRQELVARPRPVRGLPAPPKATPEGASRAIGGRKMQETLRALREQWKTDRPGRRAQPRPVEAL